jgi:mannosyltransferase
VTARADGSPAASLAVAAKTGAAKTGAAKTGAAKTGAAQARSGPGTAAPAATGTAGPIWLPVLPALVTACVVAIGITVPSYWRDEGSTVAALDRPFGALLRMLGNVDAVHGTYYVVMWPLARLMGTGELVLRTPSLLAMAVAAGLVTAIGRRIASPVVGVAAGLVFAISPMVTEYGQMARSYAMVTLAAAITSYVLVRIFEDDSKRARWVWYGLGMAVLGALNIFALLLIPAHAVTMLLRYRGRAGEARRATFLRWLVAAGAAFVIDSPLINLSYHQRIQIAWVPPPNLESVGNVLDLLGPPWMTVAILATILAGGTVSLVGAVRARNRKAAGQVPAGAADTAAGAGAGAGVGWGPICSLCVPWLVLPPAVLLIASAVAKPVYTDRYILFCMPAFALLVGAGLVGLLRLPGPRAVGWVAALTAFVVMATLGYNLQVYYRQPAGHADNIRQADQIIAANARPGDELIYNWPLFMSISAAYPDGLGRLPDPQVKEAAIPSGTLAGTTVSHAVLLQRLAHVRRLWVIEVNGNPPETKLLAGLPLHLVWTWQTSDIWLNLYVRTPAPGHSQHAR